MREDFVGLDLRWQTGDKERDWRVDGMEERERNLEQDTEKTGDLVEAKEREDDTVKGGGKSRGRFRLTGSLVVKIAAFFLLVVSGAAGFVGLIACVSLEQNGFYEGNLEDVLARQLQAPNISAMYEVIGYIEIGDIKGAAAYCKDRNVDVEVIREGSKGEETVLWSTWDGYDTKYMSAIYTCFESDESISLDGISLDRDTVYLIRAYVDPQFPVEDKFRRLAELVERCYDARFVLMGVSAGGIFLCILIFVFLMCGAGHQNGREGIVPGVLAAIPLDVLTFLFGAVAVLVGLAGLNLVWNLSTVTEFVLLTLTGALLEVLGTLYCMELAVRLKLGKCFRYSVIYMVLRVLWRGCRFLGRGFGLMLRGIPLVYQVAAAYLGLCVLEFFGVILFIRESAGFFLWAIEKAVLFPVIIFIAISCRKLLEAGRALAQGQGEYKVDTSHMAGYFKEHGEDLNSLGQGISKAVAERLRSERLKTELITNVSHDLKTPLTSIINYADLICGEAMGGGQGAGTDTACGGQGEDEPDRSKIAEYAQVLLRQSRRLKKLLEDLLEASKATTGNLEVNLEPCEADVLLSQAVGEYQQRLEEKQLELITRQSGGKAGIMADGRHLWRVFDNLLNNVCKYAQEKTRVYLSVEERDGAVLIIFRNMSKYPLDISGAELGERFVRGDKSRHMEGNGLGLSIAKSLVELQGGTMEVTTDGDLFKVSLCFAAI